MSDDIVLSPKRYPQLAGLRWNGYRWIDDRPAPTYELTQPTFERVAYRLPDPGGFTNWRTPPRKPALKKKTRRRFPLG